MKSNAKAVIKRIEAKLKRAQAEMPKVLANEGVKHFNKNFTTQSDEGQKWPEVKRRESGTFSYKYPKKRYLARRTNPILVGKTRRLKNAVNRSIKSTSQRRIVWGVYGDVGNYGFFHNYGQGQKKRQFMAITTKLKMVLKNKAYNVFRSVLK
jgi:hypothetical protein